MKNEIVRFYDCTDGKEIAYIEFSFDIGDYKSEIITGRLNTYAKNKEGNKFIVVDEKTGEKIGARKEIRFQIMKMPDLNKVYVKIL